MANSRRVSPVYNIRETRKAQTQLNRLAAKNGEFTRLWEGLCWLIQRSPTTIGALVTGKQSSYVLKTNDFMAIGIPQVVVVYSILDAANLLLEIAEVIEVAEPKAAKGKDAAKAG
jgi:hypothetical protein